MTAGRGAATRFPVILTCATMGNEGAQIFATRNEATPMLETRASVKRGRATTTGLAILPRGALGNFRTTTTNWPTFHSRAFASLRFFWMKTGTSIRTRRC